MKTFMPKEADVQREWLLVDATDLPTGRLAVVIADALLVAVVQSSGS